MNLGDKQSVDRLFKRWINSCADEGVEVETVEMITQVLISAVLASLMNADSSQLALAVVCRTEEVMQEDKRCLQFFATAYTAAFPGSVSKITDRKVSDDRYIIDFSLQNEILPARQGGAT